LFTLDSFIKIAQVAHIFGLFFPMLGLLISTKMYYAMYIFGDVFTNSSGHPSM
jgi:hypothetical protein